MAMLVAQVLLRRIINCMPTGPADELYEGQIGKTPNATRISIIKIVAGMGDGREMLCSCRKVNSFNRWTAVI